jgi:hypothetical protein
MEKCLRFHVSPREKKLTVTARGAVDTALLTASLDPAKPEMVWTLDKKARPEHGAWLVIELCDAKGAAVQRCYRKRDAATLDMPPATPGGGRINYGPTEFSYPWPETLRVRQSGSDTTEALRQGRKFSARSGQGQDAVALDFTFSIAKDGKVTAACSAPMLLKRFADLSSAENVEKRMRAGLDARLKAQTQAADDKKKAEDAVKALQDKLKKLQDDFRRTYSITQKQNLQAEMARVTQDLQSRTMDLPSWEEACKRAGTAAEASKTIHDEQEKKVQALRNEGADAFKGTRVDVLDAWGLPVVTLAPRIQ